jgi:sec-independent protein translocase protein TatA
MTHLLAISMPSVPELLVILVIVFVFVGAGKLPDVAAAMGRSVRNFKEGMRGDALDVTPGSKENKGTIEAPPAEEVQEQDRARVERG